MRHRGRRQTSTNERCRPTDQSIPPAPRRLVPFKLALRYAYWGKDKAYALIHAGKIKAYKDGRSTMVDLNTVDAYKNSLPRVL